jgi:hypothetical protein
MQCGCDLSGGDHLLDHPTGITIFELSSRTVDGMQRWYAWLRDGIGRCRPNS